MKKTKLTEKPARVASPFDASVHETERTVNQKLRNKIMQKLQGELFE